MRRQWARPLRRTADCRGRATQPLESSLGSPGEPPSQGKEGAIDKQVRAFGPARCALALLCPQQTQSANRVFLASI